MASGVASLTDVEVFQDLAKGYLPEIESFLDPKVLEELIEAKDSDPEKYNALIANFKKQSDPLFVKLDKECFHDDNCGHLAKPTADLDKMESRIQPNAELVDFMSAPVAELTHTHDENCGHLAKPTAGLDKMSVGVQANSEVVDFMSAPVAELPHTHDENCGHLAKPTADLDKMESRIQPNAESVDFMSAPVAELTHTHDDNCGHIAKPTAGLDKMSVGVQDNSEAVDFMSAPVAELTHTHDENCGHFVKPTADLDKIENRIQPNAEAVDFMLAPVVDVDHKHYENLDIPILDNQTLNELTKAIASEPDDFDVEIKIREELLLNDKKDEKPLRDKIETELNANLLIDNENPTTVVNSKLEQAEHVDPILQSVESNLVTDLNENLKTYLKKEIEDPNISQPEFLEKNLPFSPNNQDIVIEDAINPKDTNLKDLLSSEINPDQVIDPKEETITKDNLENSNLELAKDPIFALSPELPLEINLDYPIDSNLENQVLINPEITEEILLSQEGVELINPELIAGVEKDLEVVSAEDLPDTEDVKLELQQSAQEVDPELEVMLANEALPEELLETSPDNELGQELKTVAEPEVTEEILVTEDELTEVAESLVVAKESDTGLDKELELLDLQVASPLESFDPELELTQESETHLASPEDKIDNVLSNTNNIISEDEQTKLVDEITVEITNNLKLEELHPELFIPEIEVNQELIDLIALINQAIEFGVEDDIALPEELKLLLIQNPEDARMLLVNLIDVIQSSEVETLQLSGIIKLLNDGKEFDLSEIIPNLDQALNGLLNSKLEDLSTIDFRKLFANQLPDLSIEELLCFMMLMQGLKKFKGKLENLTLEEKYLMEVLLASKGNGTTLEQLTPEELEELIIELKSQLRESLRKTF